jgi:hypothetical protein
MQDVQLHCTSLFVGLKQKNYTTLNYVTLNFKNILILRKFYSRKYLFIFLSKKNDVTAITFFSLRGTLSENETDTKVTNP